MLASSDEVSATELIAIARHESDFNPRAGGHGLWPVRVADFPHRRHYACGFTQQIVHTPRACVALRDPFASYRAAADEIHQWLRLCRRMGKRGRHLIACRRRGYARGVAAARAA